MGGRPGLQAVGEDCGVSCQLLYTTVLHLERMDDFTCTVLKLVQESAELGGRGASRVAIPLLPKSR